MSNNQTTQNKKRSQKQIQNDGIHVRNKMWKTNMTKDQKKKKKPINPHFDYTNPYTKNPPQYAQHQHLLSVF